MRRLLFARRGAAISVCACSQIEWMMHIYAFLCFYSGTKLVCENTECSRDVTLWRLPNRRDAICFCMWMSCGCIQRRHNVTSLLKKQAIVFRNSFCSAIYHRGKAWQLWQLWQMTIMFFQKTEERREKLYIYIIYIIYIYIYNIYKF